MTWAKLDDQFFRHPKARAAGRDGRALFLASLCFSAGNLTDGFIAEADLPLVAAEAEVRPSVSRKLVEVGLWDATVGGWQIHDYADRNPTAESVKEKRDREREKKQRYRRGQGGRYVSPSMSTEDTRRDNPGDTLVDSRRDTPGDSRQVSTGDSFQPVPVPSSNKSSSTHVACSPAVTTTIGLITDQRIAALARPPANPTGYRQRVLADVAAAHSTAIAKLTAERPELDASAIAAIVEPPPPPTIAPRTDPLEQSAQAQRKRDERIAAAARGEACSDCDGLGVVDNGDGTFRHCEACR